MKIQLDFQDSLLQGKDKEHLLGLMVSFLDILDDILSQRIRASALSHFYRERLNRNERKLLQLFFEKNIERIREKTRKTHNVSESKYLKESEVPEVFLEIFSYFQNSVVSTRATEVSSGSKAGTTTEKESGRNE